VIDTIIIHQLNFSYFTSIDGHIQTLELMDGPLIFFYFHYQKIEKYKRKYRGNILVGKLLMDFTDRNIPSIFTERITLEK
jgi:hypothetical protein